MSLTRWSRTLHAGATAVVTLAASMTITTGSAHALSNCYDNGRPQHRFVVCTDGSHPQVWGWGQYDVRYYSAPVLSLRGRTSAHGWGEVNSAIAPYSTYIFAGGIKTGVFSVPTLRSAYGVEYLSACLTATENGTPVTRCSPSMSTDVAEA